MWTLTDAARMDESKSPIRISISDALLGNEMYLMGDSMIGTTPPLSLRLYADKLKPRSVNHNGDTGITISKACVCCNGVDIDDPIESQIAWFLLFNGDWHNAEHVAEVVDGLVEHMELRFSPNE